MAASLLDIADLAPLLDKTAALFGLDLGTKTIGVAVSDLGRRMASPLVLIVRRKFTLDVEELGRLIAKHKPAAIVIGLPLNMDGSEGPRAQATRSFVRNLLPLVDIPVVFWDERLSTVAVTRTLLEADTSRKRRGELVDKMAAAFILQGALDRLARIASDLAGDD
ncbi:MAG TPA: Holliday junction resolvase RuvX [Kaistia sp.]|nr:Holliday junction resolvase RuvX [Kaistia sp.]